jgi:hypothetical protein
LRRIKALNGSLLARRWRQHHFEAIVRPQRESLREAPTGDRDLTHSRSLARRCSPS